MEGEPAQVRMADRHEAEEVVDLALESARRERPRREGGEPRVVRRDRDEHGGAWREGGGRKGVDEGEIARARPRVRRGDELAGRAEPRESVRQRRYLTRRHAALERVGDRKSTRLNSSHSQISYAVFCLKK